MTAVENAQSLVDYANESLSTSYTNLTDIITHELDVPEQPSVTHIPNETLGVRTKSLIDYANDICDSKHDNLTDVILHELKGQRAYSVEEKEPYLFRKSGGGATIGTREHDKIVGGTIAWNQYGTNQPSEASSNGINYTAAANGYINFSGTPKASYSFVTTVGLTDNAIEYNHIYLLYGEMNNAEGDATLNRRIIKQDVTSTSNLSPNGVVKITTEYPWYFQYRLSGLSSGNTYSGSIRINVFDLTKMFGSTVADYIYSLEQSTAGAGVAWFRSLFPKPYYEYNAGELISVEGLQSHEMVGFNLWDEEWEVGSLDPSGEPKVSSTTIRSKNFNRIPPNTKCFATCLKTDGGSENRYYLMVAEYDSNKNFILRTAVNRLVFTTNEKTAYFKIYTNTSTVVYGNTYNNDICINLSDSSKNGTYEPYKKHSYRIAPVNFNIWDEEWEVGAYTSNNGGKVSVSDRIRSKNFIPVLPSTEYYTNKGIQIYRYDANKNFITWSALGSGGSFSTTADTRFITFNGLANSGTTYNNDICINLSDPAKNGTYEPYVAPLTLRGIPKLDSNNRLYFDGDEYASDGSVTRKYGIVDLGTLTWNTGTGADHTFFRSALPAKAKLGVNALFSNAYSPTSTTVYNANFPDKSAFLSTTNWGSTPNLAIRDDFYSDAATFKSAMSGVYLVYELNTPTTETAEPYASPQIVSPYGTEEYICETQADVIVPVGHDTMYSTE